jgi:uncharacterized RDD family membrane protein YckC
LFSAVQPQPLRLRLPPVLMNSLPARTTHTAEPPAAFATPALRRRMAAWLYEGILVFGLVVPAGLLYAAYLAATYTVGQDIPNHQREIQAFLFLALGLYFVYFWVKGQTLAMKTWRIRVIDRFGRPLTPGRALWRYLLGWVWILPPWAALAPFHLPPSEIAVLTLGWIAIWALLSLLQPQGQFWHDVWAGTRLIDVRSAAKD